MIFATLDSPSNGWAMVKLSPEQQAAFLQSDPKALKPASGAWGKQGCTHLDLKKINLTLARELATLAHERLLASLPQTKRSSSKAKTDSVPAKDRKSKAESATRKSAAATKKANASKQVKKAKTQSGEKNVDSRFALIFAQVDQLCLGFPDAVKTITWGEPHYRIKNKIFAGCGVEQDKPTLGCKLTKDHQAELLDRPESARPSMSVITAGSQSIFRS